MWEQFSQKTIQEAQYLWIGLVACFQGSKITLHNPDFLKLCRHSFFWLLLVSVLSWLTIPLFIFPFWVAHLGLSKLLPTYFISNNFLASCQEIAMRFLPIFPLAMVFCFQTILRRTSDKLFFSTAKLQSNSLQVYSTKSSGRLLRWFFNFFGGIIALLLFVIASTFLTIPISAILGVVFALTPFAWLSSISTIQIFLQLLATHSVFPGYRSALLMLSCLYFFGYSSCGPVLTQLLLAVANTQQFLDPLISRMSKKQFNELKSNQCFNFAYVTFGIFFSLSGSIPVIGPFFWLLGQGACSTLVLQLEAKKHFLHK